MNSASRCPKCDFSSEVPFEECPKCGVIIGKVLEHVKEVKSRQQKQVTTTRKRKKRKIALGTALVFLLSVAQWLVVYFVGSKEFLWVTYGAHIISFYLVCVVLVKIVFSEEAKEAHIWSIVFVSLSTILLIRYLGREGYFQNFSPVLSYSVVSLLKSLIVITFVLFVSSIIKIVVSAISKIYAIRKEFTDIGFGFDEYCQFYSFASGELKSSSENVVRNLCRFYCFVERCIDNVLVELKFVNIKEEVFPVGVFDKSSYLKNSKFLAVATVGIFPLVITSIGGQEAQLSVFALFFAGVWGVVFSAFILRGNFVFKLPVASLFFTGVVGINFLLLLYKFIIPDFFLDLSDSSNPLLSLSGYIFHVGVFEEACKILPVIIYVATLKEKADPMLLVLIGVFSGLGFGSFENMHYGDRAIYRAYHLTSAYGVEGLLAGVRGAMLTVLARSLSTIFIHAVWSGILSLFIAKSFLLKRSIGAYFVLGLSCVALLHGLYDWLISGNDFLAISVVVLSLMLLFEHVRNIKETIEIVKLEASLPASPWGLCKINVKTSGDRDGWQ